MPLWIRPGDTYKLWIELGPSVRPDEQPISTSSYPKSVIQLKVALFTFANELQVSGADVSEFDLETTESESPPRDRTASSRGLVPSRLLDKRVAFLVKAPARAGKHRIRCNVYFNNALVQSRLIYVRVRRLPLMIERFLRSIADPLRELSHRPRMAASRIDFSLSRTLDPHQLEPLGSPRLSMILNDNEDGTHTLRLLGNNFKADASFDGMELQDLTDGLRGVLRQTAWGSREPWKAGFQYRYADLNIEKLESDLTTLAVKGYRFFDNIINRFIDADEIKEFTDLMKEPGLVQLALKHSASLVLPAAMIYDYPLDTGAPRLRLCNLFRANMSSKDTFLGDTPCFRGSCPNRDDLEVVCPGGFWGFRHSLGMPLSVAKGTSAPLVLECASGPHLAIAVSTDPQFTMRAQHEIALKRLLADDGWHYCATRNSVPHLLTNTSVHVVYFYCHGGMSGSTPFLLVGQPGEAGITRDNLRSWKVNWVKPRPLVFINGCHTAALEPKTALNFVSGFVETAKAAGVIGTEITVFEPLASAFAEDCLRRFIQRGDEIGKAVRDARLTLLKAGNPLGLVYIPYVVPTLRLGDSVDKPES
ncbi:hypothetical protein [Granulicella sp. S190]|uniref:hypothetical protein n=1 Tax=Granulicella sp. S190 TaxID=1747226 RepID=UPI00131E97F9|nr:hypothetical protein [Granulicella sp. S190]